VAILSSEPSLDERVYRAARQLSDHGFLGVFVNVGGNLSQISGPPGVYIEGPDGHPFHISPLSFGQANLGVNRLIGETIAEWIAPREFPSALELFGGASNHTLSLAPHVGRYRFSELDLSACKAAERNLSVRGLSHVAVEGGEALDIYRRWGSGVALVILNPPRQGHRRLCETLAKGNHRAVLYISCNPATLARDLEPLHKAGYHIEEAAGFDMFPQTPHVETAVLMTR
jgi:23S rRNA (uracil1939-C5)-methyltransferase